MTMQTYCLNRHLDSAAALPIASALQAMRGNDLHIDGRGVGFAGALSLQVLIAARAQWDADNCAFHIAPLSAELANAASGLGIALSAIGAASKDIVDAEFAQ